MMPQAEKSIGRERRGGVVQGNSFDVRSNGEAKQGAHGNGEAKHSKGTEKPSDAWEQLC